MVQNLVVIVTKISFVLQGRFLLDNRFESMVHSIYNYTLSWRNKEECLNFVRAYLTL